MNIPSEVAEIIKKLNEKYTPNLKDETWQEVYKFTKMVCGQLRWSFPVRDWVYLTHPYGHSDKFGYVEGNTVHSWDYIISASGPSARLNLVGIYGPFILGQYDIDRETPIDYLSDDDPKKPVGDTVTQDEFRKFKGDLSDELSGIYNILESIITMLRR